MPLNPGVYSSQKDKILANGSNFEICQQMKKNIRLMYSIHFKNYFVSITYDLLNEMIMWLSRFDDGFDTYMINNIIYLHPFDKKIKRTPSAQILSFRVL